MPWFQDLALSTLFLLAPLVGGPAVRRWERRGGVALDPATRVAAAAALGIAWCQLGGMVLIFTRQLTALSAGAWLIAGLGIGVAGLRRPRISGALLAWALPGLLLLLPLLLMATVPPWYQDDMTYHLALPRAFAVAGRYAVPDDNIFAFLPLGWESVLSLLCAFGEAPDRFPPFNPRLLGVWTTGFAALGACGLARSLGVPPRAAWFAGVLLLLHPTLRLYAPSAYVEPWLLLLASLAAQATLRALVGERAAAVPAGLFAGLCASCKFHGLVVAGLLGLALLLWGPGGRELRPALRRVAGFAAAAVLSGAPFYVRTWIQRGNPFFPSAWGLFGGEGWSAWRAWAWGEILSNYGAGRALRDWLLLPWRFATTRELYDLFEGSVGPVLVLGLLLLPGYAWRERGAPGRARAVMVLAGVVLCFSLFWAHTTQQLRFWMPALPVAAALATAGYDALSARLRPAVFACALAASLAWQAGLERRVWDRQHTSAWLAGRMDRDALLRAMLPESYGLYAELEALVPPQGRIWLVWMRNMTYYLRREARVDCVFEAWRFEALLDEETQPEGAAARLRRDGITHVLIHHRFFLAGRNADLSAGRTERLQRRFLALIQAGVLRPIRRWDTIALYEVAVDP